MGFDFKRLLKAGGKDVLSNFLPRLMQEMTNARDTVEDKDTPNEEAMPQVMEALSTMAQMLVSLQKQIREDREELIKLKEEVASLKKAKPGLG